MATPPDVLAGSATGSIYDLGYRGYDGPRLGRRHAVAALFVAQPAWPSSGSAASGRAKIAPLVLGGLIAAARGLQRRDSARSPAAAAAGSTRSPSQGYLPFVPDAARLLRGGPGARAARPRPAPPRADALLQPRPGADRLRRSRSTWRCSSAVALVLRLPQVVLLLGMLFAHAEPRRTAWRRSSRCSWPVVRPHRRRRRAPRRRRARVASAFTVRRAFAAGAIIAVFLVLSGVVTVLVNRVGLDGPLAARRAARPVRAPRRGVGAPLRRRPDDARDPALGPPDVALRGAVRCRCVAAPPALGRSWCLRVPARSQA